MEVFIYKTSSSYIHRELIAIIDSSKLSRWFKDNPIQFGFKYFLEVFDDE